MAEKRLSNQTEGTFLVRLNNGTYKLSQLLSSGRKFKHQVIYQTNGLFSLTKQKKFASLKDLVENYMNVKENNKFFLGKPLNDPRSENITKNRTDDDIKRQRDLSRRKEPFSLQYFHGSLPSKEASQKLFSESVGTFLLRTNEEDEYRLTFKKPNNKIEHMRIHFRNSVYYCGGSEEKPYSSLRRLVDHLIEDRQIFSIPLRSAIHERRTSTPAVEAQEDKHEFDRRMISSLRKICSVDPGSHGSPIASNVAKEYNRAISSDESDAIDEEEENPEFSEEHEIVIEENQYEDTDNTNENLYENVENEEEEKHPCIGVMTVVEAANFLDNKPLGSWVLRLNETGDKRIAVKRPRRIMHIKLFEEDDLYSLTQGDVKKSLDELLETMVEQGTLGDQITQQ